MAVYQHQHHQDCYRQYAFKSSCSQKHLPCDTFSTPSVCDVQQTVISILVPATTYHISIILLPALHTVQSNNLHEIKSTNSAEPCCTVYKSTATKRKHSHAQSYFTTEVLCSNDHITLDALQLSVTISNHLNYISNL